MLPSISAVVSVEMIRDGGSLAALFIGTNGSKYCLHFKLLSKFDANGDHLRLGYAKPILFERLEFREENRVGWCSINEIEVSWEHAIVLLHNLRRLLPKERDLEWITVMEESANAEGGLPSSIEPRSKTKRFGDPEPN